MPSLSHRCHVKAAWGAAAAEMHSSHPEDPKGAIQVSQTPPVHCWGQVGLGSAANCDEDGLFWDWEGILDGLSGLGD